MSSGFKGSPFHSASGCFVRISGGMETLNIVQNADGNDVDRSMRQRQWELWRRYQQAAADNDHHYRINECTINVVVFFFVAFASSSAWRANNKNLMLFTSYLFLFFFHRLCVGTRRLQYKYIKIISISCCANLLFAIHIWNLSNRIIAGSAQSHSFDFVVIRDELVRW